LLGFTNSVHAIRQSFAQKNVVSSNSDNENSNLSTAKTRSKRLAQNGKEYLEASDAFI
jgi:hypothetical protein